MAEATWGDAIAPSIDWKMSASLENVPRGDTEVPEVTNLGSAARAWQGLDPATQNAATLTLERAVNLTDGLPIDHFVGVAIADLAKRLPD